MKTNMLFHAITRYKS